MKSEYLLEDEFIDLSFLDSYLETKITQDGGVIKL